MVGGGEPGGHCQAAKLGCLATDYLSTTDYWPNIVRLIKSSRSFW